MENKLENILDKVYEMYNRYGIKSVTMDDVASMLGISKKTLYQFVKDKSDLVAKVIEQKMTQTECERGDIMGENLSAIEELFKITYFITKHVKHYNPTLEFDLRKYYPAIHKKIEEKKQKSIYEGISRNLKKGIGEGVYRKEIDVDIITKVFVSRMLNSFKDTIFTKEEIASTRVFKEIMIYHLYGICNSTGVKIIEEKMEATHNMEELV